MSEGIDQFSGTITVELILDRLVDLGPSLDRPLGHRVDVLDVQMDHHRRPPVELRTLRIHLGELFGEHDAGRADLELGMADFVQRTVDPDHFLGSEGSLVEVDGPGALAHNQIGGDLGSPVGNPADWFRHTSSWVRGGILGDVSPRQIPHARYSVRSASMG